MEVTIEVKSCSECPHLGKGVTFGHNGADGHRVWVCKKDAFGKILGDGYVTGEIYKPEGIHKNCPFR
jgi:hypothetical protein